MNDKPNLGLATNRELLDELQARILIHFPGGLDYRTYDGEEIVKKANTIAYEVINPDREDQGESVLGFTKGKENE